MKSPYCLAALFAFASAVFATTPAPPPPALFAGRTAKTTLAHQAGEARANSAKSLGSDGLVGDAAACLHRTKTTWGDLDRRLLAQRSAEQVHLRFQSDGNGGFTFDTGILRGRLHAKGKSLGLTEVVHVPTRARLDRSNGLLSHYRVFTSGKRYGGGAWDWPSTAALLDAGQVEVRWPAAEGRPFALRATYRLVSATTIEVETVVEAKAALSGFESFLASYFAPAFTNALVKTKAGGGAQLAPATPDKGDWQMYLRDPAARALALDGRWKLEPNPVAWTFPAEFAGPTAEVQRRAPGLGLTAALQAPAKEVFALALPHQTEGHFSVYFSQFGRNLQPGETAHATVRLTLSAAEAP